VRSRVIAALRAATGDKIAVRDERRSLTYSNLRQAVESEARWLRGLGVRRCALLADNGADWIIADLALLAGGLINAPLPDWFTAPQLERVLEDAGVDCILTDDPERVRRDHAAFAPAGAAPHSGLAAFRSERRVRGHPLQADVAKVTYTSGSTGAPKGVSLTLDAIETAARSLVLALPFDVTRHLCVTPLATLLENIAGVYAPLLLGATCIAPSRRTTGVSFGALDARAFLDTVARYSPHSLILAPELLRIMVAGASSGWRPPESLRFAAVGGAPVSQALLDEAARFGIPAYQGYGLSECASVVCLNTPLASRRGSVGRALAHARVRIDEHGEIRVRGAAMAGYVGASPTSVDEIATGDLGEIDADGFVYVRGRAKNMFITSMGRNVSPEWVEAELLREPALAQAVVSGEGRPWPAALLYPAPGQAEPQQIERAVAAANARLPEHARVRCWGRLPAPLGFRDGALTANGRPRRDVIAQRYAALVDSLYATALTARG
jgi:long-subunit acyl-CoA synthetase (AMP-forming)